MNPMLEHEIERLLQLFSQRGKPLSPVALKSDAVFEEARRRTRIALGNDVEDFHRRFGGRDYEDLFAVEIAGPTLLAFLSLPDALDAWVGTGPHEAPTYDDLELP